MGAIYVFGGYILTGGSFTDKRTGNNVPWVGGVALLAPVNDSKDTPQMGKIAKFRRNDTLISKLSALTSGEPCQASFDMDGRLVDISPIYAKK